MFWAEVSWPQTWGFWKRRTESLLSYLSVTLVSSFSYRHSRVILDRNLFIFFFHSYFFFFFFFLKCAFFFGELVSWSLVNVGVSKFYQNYVCFQFLQSLFSKFTKHKNIKYNKWKDYVYFNSRNAYITKVFEVEKKYFWIFSHYWCIGDSYIEVSYLFGFCFFF